MTDQPVPFITLAGQAADAAHDNIVQLYTLLDVLSKRKLDPTPEQASHLAHNLINLEDQVMDLRLRLSDLGVLPRTQLSDILDTATFLNKMVEQLADQWQRDGKPTQQTAQEQYAGNGQQYAAQVAAAKKS